MAFSRCRLALLVVAGTLGCASRAPPLAPAAGVEPHPGDTSGRASLLPPVPPVRAPLALRVVYPAPDAQVRVRDSSFLFGSAGTGDASVTVNGVPARVWPNGAWLAWLPFPPDSVMQFRIEARTGSDSASMTYSVRRAGVPRPPAAAPWIDSTALSPIGKIWWPRDEYLTLTARAGAGATVRVRLPGGGVVPLVAEAAPPVVASAVRAFGQSDGLAQVEGDRYVGVIRGRSAGPDPGPMLPLSPIPFPLQALSLVTSALVVPVDSAWPVLEAISGSDTVRTRWPLQLALLDSLPEVVDLDDDSAGTGGTDSLTAGRALPGGTYHWFFPTGTRAEASGRINGELRLRLGRSNEAWVLAADAHPAPAGTPSPRAVVGSVVLQPAADRVTLRIPLSARIPFQIAEKESSLALRLYGAVGDVDWMRYGPADSLVQRLGWAQSGTDEVTLSAELARPLWGYRSRWEGDDLLLEIRRPPPLDRGAPLRGRLIMVDPGHPPAGATGPTGLREAEANLGVSLELRRLLEAAGAKVLMTRTADSAVDLWPRVKLADTSNADLLVSIHNNALPDGVNPFINTGTSVYYNHVPSIALARAVQQALVRRLGIRDLGLGRGDLALVRGTWMPSVLTEGLFIMLPDQEYALRTPEGRRLYATAVFEGIRQFLRDRAPE